MPVHKRTVILEEKLRAAENLPAIRQGRLCTSGPAFIEDAMYLTHGHTNTPVYASWRHMIERCQKPTHHAWHNYGGRGIRVCERWKRFENFLADMGERPNGKQIDWIDNNGNYEPGNCRWATRAEQLGNTRCCRVLTFNGKTQNVTAWAEETGIPRNCIYFRIGRLGWSVEEALTQPSRALSISPRRI